MYAEPEKEYLEMNSVFDWIERPLSAVGRIPLNFQRPPPMFEPQSLKRQDSTGDAVVTFAYEPENARFSPTRRLVTLQNTYQLEPACGVFKPHLLKPVIQLILHNHLQGKLYNVQEAPELCKFLADVIKDQAMKLNLPRYKFVSDVMIGQKNEQGFITASRCLWDQQRDNFTSVSYENQSLFAVATLYGLLYE